MKEYPDPWQHFEEFTQRYADGLKQAGLEPTPKLNRAMAKRIGEEAEEDYSRKAEAVFLHNLDAIDAQYRAHIRQRKRSGLPARLTISLPCAALFTAMAWVGFSQANNVTLFMYGVAALVAFGIAIQGIIDLRR